MYSDIYKYHRENDLTSLSLKKKTTTTTTAIVADCRLAFTTQPPTQQASDALYLLLISGSCIGSAQMTKRELPCSMKILREFYFADWRFFVVCGNKFWRFEMTEISGRN